MMQPFKKRAELVEAEQFFVSQKPWPEGVVDGTRPGEPSFFSIDTPVGDLAIHDGDWIVKCDDCIGLQRRAANPDVFHKLYEPVEEPVPA